MINNYFRTTKKYKEFLILNLISKNKNITQREISFHVGTVVSMVNKYIDEFSKKGFITKKKITSKKVIYKITKDGTLRQKFLNIGYLKNAQAIYDEAKENMEYFLQKLIETGVKNILLYGAGEVANIFLHSILFSNKSKINVLGIIDDDVQKINNFIFDTKIISIHDITEINHDGILISSYRNKDKIYRKLLKINYNSNKIYNFFDL